MEKILQEKFTKEIHAIERFKNCNIEFYDDTFFVVDWSYSVELEENRIASIYYNDEMYNVDATYCLSMYNTLIELEKAIQKVLDNNK